ncbi:hypothetical protein [Pseudoduganella violaceinigra]|uniref:hypothetical protein n=1 Tax=Pseudoduganella violaceinigra TaxID=246602 RepID=UPI00040F606E|nr:hypothetical protein [Pseudoduganella violaceinigra]
MLRLKLLGAAILAGIAAAPGVALAGDLVANIRAQLGSQSLQAGELRWQDGPLRAVLTATRVDGGNVRLRLNELSYDSPLAGGFLSAGKKVMSWDVGYAFRPLDVVQREDRRALNPLALDGIPMLAWEHFNADSATTVVWANPGRGSAASASDQRHDEAIAVRQYRQRGARDEYGVLRLSRRNGIEAGLSFSQVASDALELHASLLWQQHPQHGGKALAGFTWTTESKFSVLGEAWTDRSAPPRQQGNQLLRASQYFDDVEVSADMLWQPQAGSRIGTLSGSWKTGPWVLSASYRHFAGPAGRYARNVALASLQRGF